MGYYVGCFAPRAAGSKRWETAGFPTTHAAWTYLSELDGDYAPPERFRAYMERLSHSPYVTGWAGELPLDNDVPDDLWGVHADLTGCLHEGPDVFDRKWWVEDHNRPTGSGYFFSMGRM